MTELPPEIKTKMVDQVIAEGEPATFQVELTKGDAKVKWFKDGKEIQFSEHTQLAISGKHQRLVIPRSTKEDAGVYSCEIGDQKCTATLKVEGWYLIIILLQCIKIPDITIITAVDM